MIDSTVRLVGNGYTVTLTDSAKELHRLPGGSGWGMAPVVNSWFEGAGDGDIHRGTRRARRELVFPIAALGGTPRQVEAQIRNLVRIIRDPFRVYIDLQDGNSYWIEAIYDSGLEGAYSATPAEWNEMSVVLHCPDPYWTSDEGQSFVIAPVPAASPFLDPLTGLNVASSAAFGTVTINNVGDVASRPTLTIHGPGEDPTFLVNGVGFVLEKTLTSTDVVTVKYEDGGWTIEDQTGANLYGDLAVSPPPVFPELPPGVSVVTATMTSTGVESFILGTYPERREVVY